MFYKSTWAVVASQLNLGVGRRITERYSRLRVRYLFPNQYSIIHRTREATLLSLLSPTIFSQAFINKTFRSATPIMSFWCAWWGAKPSLLFLHKYPTCLKPSLMSERLGAFVGSRCPGDDRIRRTLYRTVNRACGTARFLES